MKPLELPDFVVSVRVLVDTCQIHVPRNVLVSFGVIHGNQRAAFCIYLCTDPGPSSYKIILKMCDEFKQRLVDGYLVDRPQRRVYAA